MSETDRALTTRTARPDSGDPDDREATVRHLIQQEAGPLLDYFHRRTLSPDDAADLLGDTLVVVWRRERSIPDDAVRARMWLYGVARKVLAGHRRTSRRRRALTERLSAELLSLPAHPVDQLTLETRELLAVLNEKDQEIIRLVYWDGFTLDQAATILSMRPGTVRSRHSRARAQLRAIITDAHEGSL